MLLCGTDPEPVLQVCDKVPGIGLFMCRFVVVTIDYEDLRYLQCAVNPGA